MSTRDPHSRGLDRTRGDRRPRPGGPSSFLRTEPARFQGPAGPGTRHVGLDLPGMPPALHTDQPFTVGAGLCDRLARRRLPMPDLSRRARPSPERTRRRHPGLRRVPQRPPRARGFVAGDGRLGLHAMSRRLEAAPRPGAGTRSVGGSVSRFDTAHHPEFRTTPDDRAMSPRRVKFNHARHLAAGLTLEEGGMPFTFAQLAPQDRARYGWALGQELDVPVRLACAACHQLDGEDQVGGVLERRANRMPARSPGASMLPVVFDVHCAACHPLPFDASFPEKQVPHGVAPAELNAKLRQFYAAQVVRADPAALRQVVPPRPLPGQSAGSREQRFEEAIEAKVLTAAKLLFGSSVDEATRRRQKLPQGRGGCVECHNLKASAGPLIRAGPRVARNRTGPHDAGLVRERRLRSYGPSRARVCRLPRRSNQLAGKRRSAPFARARSVRFVPLGGGRPADGPARGSERGLHGVSPLSQRRSSPALQGRRGAAGGRGAFDPGVPEWRRGGRPG